MRAMEKRPGPAGEGRAYATKPGAFGAARSTAPPARTPTGEAAGAAHAASAWASWAASTGRIPPVSAPAWADALERRGDEALAELVSQPPGRFSGAAAPAGGASAAFAASRARRFGVRSAPDAPAAGDAFAASRARRFGRP